MLGIRSNQRVRWGKRRSGANLNCEEEAGFISPPAITIIIRALQRTGGGMAPGRRPTSPAAWNLLAASASAEASPACHDRSSGSVPLCSQKDTDDRSQDALGGSGALQPGPFQGRGPEECWRASPTTCLCARACKSKLLSWAPHIIPCSMEPSPL